MFRRSFAGLLALLLAIIPALAFAQVPADADGENVVPIHSGATVEDVTLRGIDKTKAYTLEFAADGTPTLTPTKISVAGPTPPGPGPTPPGPTPALNDFGKAIKAAADKATGDADRLNTAQGLAMLYRSISTEAHKAGTTATLETVSNTTLLITDTALTKQGAEAVKAWADMRAALRAALVDSVQKGQAVSQMGDLLDQAALGLEASAPKTAPSAPSPEFWAFLMKLLEMLLPLLLPLLK